MNCREIVAAYLRGHGYEGLAGEECGCVLDDLMPCEGGWRDCVPARRMWYDPADVYDAQGGGGGGEGNGNGEGEDTIIRSTVIRSTVNAEDIPQGKIQLGTDAADALGFCREEWSADSYLWRENNEIWFSFLVKNETTPRGATWRLIASVEAAGFTVAVSSPSDKLRRILARKGFMPESPLREVWRRGDDEEHGSGGHGSGCSRERGMTNEIAR